MVGHHPTHTPETQNLELPPPHRPGTCTQPISHPGKLAPTAGPCTPPNPGLSCLPAAAPSHSGPMPSAPGLAPGPAAGGPAPAGTGAGCPAQPLVPPGQRWGAGEHRSQVRASGPIKISPLLPSPPPSVSLWKLLCGTVHLRVCLHQGRFHWGAFPVEPGLRRDI